MQVRRKEDYNTRHRIVERGGKKSGVFAAASVVGEKRGERGKEYDVVRDHPDSKAGGQHQQTWGYFSVSPTGVGFFFLLANRKKKKKRINLCCEGIHSSCSAGGMGYLLYTTTRRGEIKKQFAHWISVHFKEDNLVALHFKSDQARRRFVEWAQNEIAVVPDFHKRILFSDEAHFWLNGYVNKQNCRIWSEVNPQVYVETPLHPEKLTVWCT
ncbi:hypothetical protein TNCV_4581061 [Trichonephila clavipes]|nr:hypothetical protein TNCV_4581061 [Trichonephila clavipes]